MAVPTQHRDPIAHRRLIAGLLNLLAERQPVVFDDLSASADATIESEEFPNWARKVIITFKGLTNSTSNDILIQLYDTAVVTSGYNSVTSRIGTASYTSTGSSSGINISVSASTDSIHGEVTLTKQAGDVWAASVNCCRSDATVSVVGGGQATLSDLLTKIRLNGNGGNITGTIGVRVER